MPPSPSSATSSSATSSSATFSSATFSSATRVIPAPITTTPALAILLSLPGLAAGSAAELPAASTLSATMLRAEAERAAGRPVHLDPRLRIPACARFTFEPGPTAVTIRCPDTGWRLVALASANLPGAATPPAIRPVQPPAIRRGDQVRVIHAGPGFTIAVDAIAEGTGGPGDRILLKNRLTGARFPATIGADGAITR